MYWFTVSVIFTSLLFLYTWMLSSFAKPYKSCSLVSHMSTSKITKVCLMRMVINVVYWTRKKIKAQCHLFSDLSVSWVKTFQKSEHKMRWKTRYFFSWDLSRFLTLHLTSLFPVTSPTWAVKCLLYLNLTLNHQCNVDQHFELPCRKRPFEEFQIKYSHNKERAKYINNKVKYFKNW